MSLFSISHFRSVSHANTHTHTHTHTHTYGGQARGNRLPQAALVSDGCSPFALVPPLTYTSSASYRDPLDVGRAHARLVGARHAVLPRRPQQCVTGKLSRHTPAALLHLTQRQHKPLFSLEQQPNTQGSALYRKKVDSGCTRVVYTGAADAATLDLSLGRRARALSLLKRRT